MAGSNAEPRNTVKLVNKSGEFVIASDTDGSSLLWRKKGYLPEAELAAKLATAPISKDEKHPAKDDKK